MVRITTRVDGQPIVAGDPPRRLDARPSPACGCPSGRRRAVPAPPARPRRVRRRLRRRPRCPRRIAAGRRNRHARGLGRRRSRHGSGRADALPGAAGTRLEQTVAEQLEQLERLGEVADAESSEPAQRNVRRQLRGELPTPPPDRRGRTRRLAPPGSRPRRCSHRSRSAPPDRCARPCEPEPSHPRATPRRRGACCACKQAASAASTSAKTTKQPSPSVFTSTPPHGRHASRRISRWRSIVAANRASPRRALSADDPSMSVKQNVTSPLGHSGIEPASRLAVAGRGGAHPLRRCRRSQQRGASADAARAPARGRRRSGRPPVGSRCGNRGRRSPSRPRRAAPGARATRRSRRPTGSGGPIAWPSAEERPDHEARRRAARPRRRARSRAGRARNLRYGL